jgi:hypothetical protein
MRAVEHPLEFVNALPAFLGWPYAPYGWWPGHRRKPARSRYAWCRDVLPAKGGAGLNISDLRERNGIVNLPRGRRAEVGWSGSPGERDAVGVALDATVLEESLETIPVVQHTGVAALA